MFTQQSLQPKLSRRRYASVLYALQNNTVFRRAQNWVSVSDGSRTDNGSEFPSVGPETAKCLWPYLVVELQGYPAQLNGGDHDCALCIANIMCLLQAVMCMFKSLSLEKRNDVLKSLYVHLSSLGTVECDLDGLFTVDVDLFTSQLLVSVNRLSSDEAGIKSVWH